MQQAWLWLVGYAVAVNALAFGMFAWDKFSAQNGGWRISEASLLLVALVGGTVGAMLAQYRLRHKTRKEPFRSVLFGIAVMQALILPLLMYPPARHALWLGVIGHATN